MSATIDPVSAFLDGPQVPRTLTVDPNTTLWVHVGVGPERETHIYRAAQATWTEHGTLLVVGIRTNGSRAPRETRAEYPAIAVTSTEVVL